MPKMHSELKSRYADVLAPASPEAKLPGAEMLPICTAVWQEKMYLVTRYASAKGSSANKPGPRAPCCGFGAAL